MGKCPHPRLTAVFVLLVLLTSACRSDRGARPSEPATTGTAVAAPAQPPGTRETARVLRVVDGDTILVELDGRQERVRYIGVDTPETVAPDRPPGCFGQEANAANKALVEGKTVQLERDVSERDRFDRLLRYVYVGEVFVNEELVRQGYATATTFPPDVRENTRFRALEREARQAGRGLWGACRR